MAIADTTKKPESKYQQIAEALREQIQSGVLEPGDRLPSLAEMYQEHGLSRSTVERVHRLLEMDGLVVREQGRGTFVTKPAKGSKGLIGFSGFAFEESPRSPYWTDVMKGLQQSAAREEQGVILLDSQTFSGWDRVDGLVLADSLATVKKRLPLLPPNMPRVSILTETPMHDCVVPNTYQGGQLIAEHLLALGHRRISCLLARDAGSTDRRYAGFRDVLKAAGVEFDEQWAREFETQGQVNPDFAEHGRRIMREWLAGNWHELGCTALMLQNDLVGVGVLDVLKEAGIAVPAEVSVVGFDNLELCEYLSPRLTSVEVPLHEIAMTAVKLLRQQIEYGVGMPATTVLPVKLQARDSTAPPKK